MYKSFVIAFVLFYQILFCQSDGFKSILEEQSTYYQSLHLKTECQFDSVAAIKNGISQTVVAQRSTNSNTCTLNKKVFGWHPYWLGSSYTSYQWNLLSDLCYFNYDISPTTGSNTNTSFAWTTASVVTIAKSNNTDIHICATMFNGHNTFWASQTAQTGFITNIVALLNARGGNGVNIDFEGMGASDKIPFVTFMTNLKNALTTANPNYKLSVCLYAVDWSGVFNITALDTIVDFYTIMGYDYYYAGSPVAGPTSPLYNLETTYNYTLTKSITTYIKAGATPSKLLLGLPYYGREWEVASNSIPATTTGSFTASRTLSYINNTPTTYSITNKFWEGNCYSPYYSYQISNSWRQCFIDDVYSLGRKYDLVNQRGLGGIGIWALGYDAGITSYWDLLENKFTNCTTIECNDSLFDMGGPTSNYYNNEAYEYSLAVSSGSLLNLQFKSFNIEQGHDSLFLYNGSNSSSPLIGAYTGTNSPGLITAAGQFLTIRFKSDGATTASGFSAIKSCIPNIVTAISSDKQFDQVLVYPNPTNGVLFFNRTISFQLLNMQGALMISKEVIIEMDNSIDLAELNLSKGIYLLKIIDVSGRTYVKKLIFID